jgi:hypothetical protein
MAVLGGGVLWGGVPNNPPGWAAADAAGTGRKPRALTPGPQCATQVGKALALVAAPLLMTGNALAATELAQLAASDNRVAIIGTLFVPVLGWVGFNMLQPALNQLERMSDKTVSGARGVGLGS